MQSHPFLESLQKKERNLNKKLREIEDLKSKFKQGVQIKPEQQEKLNNVQNILNQIEEINKYKLIFEQSLKENTDQRKKSQGLAQVTTTFEKMVSLFENQNDSESQDTLKKVQENPQEELRKYLESNQVQKSLKK